jgi:hypothetical protein
MNLIYPASIREPAIAGIGCSDNHHLNGPIESINGNMGDLPSHAKESGSTDIVICPKTSNGLGRSQRSHSTRSVGEPRTRGRATAWRLFRRDIAEC